VIERPVGAEEPVSALAVFRNRPFLILWLSQVATQVGGNMVLYGLTVLVFTASGSNSAVSILLISFLAPAVVFGAVAGVYVDRFDRRLVLVATSLVRSGLFFILVFVGANVGLILLANLMVSIATTFFAPAELSVIPRVVPRGQLTAANGIFTLTLNAAFALGYTLLGPLVVTIAGPTLLIGIVASCTSSPPASAGRLRRRPRCRCRPVMPRFTKPGWRSAPSSASFARGSATSVRTRLSRGR